MRKMFTFSSICMHSSHMNCSRSSSSSTAPWKKSAWNSSSLVTIQFLFNFVFYLVPCDVRSLVTLFSPSPSLCHSRTLFSTFLCIVFFFFYFAPRMLQLPHNSFRCTFGTCVYKFVCRCLYHARERKSKRVKKNRHTHAQQRINVITIKDHHSRSSSSSSFSERRDNFWTLFQAWLIHMFCLKKWMKEDDEEKKKKKEKNRETSVLSSFIQNINFYCVCWCWLRMNISAFGQSME